MILWRISRHKDLCGTGGLRADGRWHYAGQPIVYLSESPAAALLEVCVHTASSDVPPDFTLLRIEGPEVKIASVAVTELLKGWQERVETTRELGMKWLQVKKTVLLRVPSAIIPETANYLFNPVHPDAKKFRVTEALRCPFDARIKR
ncbi:MAG: RES family NAD+ phosphorylase [Acidobacteriaceae bacterium]